MSKPSARPQRRLIVAVLALSVLGGTAATASAKTHVTCVINTDSATPDADHGLCLVVPLPDLPDVPELPDTPKLPKLPK